MHFLPCDDPVSSFSRKYAIEVEFAKFYNPFSLVEKPYIYKEVVSTTQSRIDCTL